MKHVLAACIVAFLAAHVPAQNISVSADASVSVTTYNTFEGRSPQQRWVRIDELEFWAIPRTAPQDYYSSVNATSRDTLRTTLHNLLDEHTVLPYTHRSRPGQQNHRIDTWDVIALADAHPLQPNRVLDIYLNGTFDRQLGGVRTDPRYDREHSWPKSLGFPDNQLANDAYSDCHHLFAAYNSYNSSRSNKPYRNAAQANASRRRTTLENIGRGGSFHDEPDSSNYSPTGSWQTWIGRRGEVARAIFYMAIRYEGDVAGEADLRLTENTNHITQNDATDDRSDAFMGIRSVLLRWHQEDPVDDLERRRNTVVFLFQGNRNPFIDHPEWVAIAFGQGATTPPATGRPWINEFHYDDAGDDEGEFVEIAGPAGLDLSGWQVIGYNGSGGRRYKTIQLSGQIPNQQNGFGTLAFDFSRMQNGGPDGLALVDPEGHVHHLLAYEGRFDPVDGAAAGQTANNINVSENNSTRAGHSLQLRGTGASHRSFNWAGPEQASRGRVNQGQTLRSQ